MLMSYSAKNLSYPDLAVIIVSSNPVQVAIREGASETVSGFTVIPRHMFSQVSQGLMYKNDD